MHFYLILTLLTTVLRAEDGVQVVTDRSEYPYAVPMQKFYTKLW